MKVNYDFYTGKDTYSDGEVEQDVIDHLEKYGEENYKKVFEHDIRWPVFYHVTPLRKNIVNWYPFKQDAEVLEIGAGMGAITGILSEKVKQVTSVELSKQRAKAIEIRCKEKDNVELIVANFNDIQWNKKFDYITLIGVLEYAPLYTKSENPFQDFLKQIKSLLKEDGKLLIAIENQYGMKYFSGAPEDHTAKKYDGIMGYENKNGIRTFGKNELIDLLKESGLSYTKFYYPLPDYKLPVKMFSDDYLPDGKTIQEYPPYLFGEDMEVEYDERKALEEITKNNMFSFFANSFFIEASAKEIDTKVDLEQQELIKVDESMKPFFERHYKIVKDKIVETNDKEVLTRLIQENEKLKQELNKMANSKSWKITKPLRKITNKIKKERGK